MTTYLYDEKLTRPDLDSIHAAVAGSLMTDKTLLYCEWCQACEMMKVHFENDLSVADKLILDVIVEAYS